MQSYSSILTMLLGVFVGGFLMHVLLSWVWRSADGDNLRRAEASERDPTVVVDWPMLERRGETEIREQADFVAWLNKSVTAKTAGDRGAEARIPSS